MSNFDSVEFDWDNCKVCFDGFWKASVASYKGGTPWDRSIVAECSNQADNTSEIHYDINPKLDGERREGLARLLCEFADVFVLDPKKPTRTNLGEHLIYTNGAQPVKQPLRRMPPIWEAEVNCQVEEMLRNSVCRPSKSPWNSSIVLVKRKMAL
ncbi:Transposon Ty3-I Gag-Pol polyprotein [Oopsacas minuta]|uniref:Transposon Ty3-I Gag-Pol polyprotein n=1 Tax=Oopsacas minuta TaxID=111878 RepID=A0AAV7JH83_9METZ|nr:Transposon Ty3-I Gag-Pol polyprotein [Oopsacas minuta]